MFVWRELAAVCRVWPEIVGQTGYDIMLSRLLCAYLEETTAGILSRLLYAYLEETCYHICYMRSWKKQTSS